MTNSEKKQRLQQYIQIQRETDRLYDEINRLQAQAEKVTAFLSTELKGGSSKDRMAIVDEIVEKKQQLEEKVREAFAARSAIVQAIDSVKSPLHHRVLAWRYLNGATFEEIAVREGYTYNHVVMRVHPTALSMVKFDAVLKKDAGECR